ncbi:MAG: hypothetical protein ACI97A_000434 [Planctomycetota bacterium]|jgi:hypothetical protein
MRQLHALLIALTLFFLAEVTSAQIGIVLKRVDGQKLTDSHFMRGAQAALDTWKGLGKGPHFNLLSQEIVTGDEATKAAELLKKSGAQVIVTDYLGADILAQLRDTCHKLKLPLVTFEPSPQDVADAVEDLIVDRLRINNLALLSGKGKHANKLKRILKKQLVHFQEMSFQERINAKAKKIDPKIRKEKTDGILLDGSPAEVEAALHELKEVLRIPIFLTPRSFLPGMKLPMKTYVLSGQSPLTHKAGLEFNVAFKEKHEVDPEMGSGAGHDAIMFCMQAAKNGTNKILESYPNLKVMGPRGEIKAATDANPGSLQSPMAIWTLDAGKTMALLPGPENSGPRAKNDLKKRVSVPRFGVPFGVDMSNRFELEPGTQKVLVSWGVPGQATIDEDLRLLGLSTQGKCPLADHLIKKELLGRMMAITSKKFLRLPNGKSRSGESYKISFATHLPPKTKKAGSWKVIIAGDDPEAGGRAFPGTGLALTFSTFLRRTIFQPKAIDPPLCAMDLPDLLGCKSQDEFYDDARALMIHALVDGYAGSMALTTAHEVGHLTGLGHITDDSKGIMNVVDGAGLGYRVVAFSKGSKENLNRSLGIVEKSAQ